VPTATSCPLTTLNLETSNRPFVSVPVEVAVGVDVIGTLMAPVAGDAAGAAGAKWQSSFQTWDLSGVARSSHAEVICAI
jgi:hypothetical protein